MALPILHRQLILDDFVTRLTALKTITEGVDYRHKLVTVDQKPRTVEQVDSLETPMVFIVGGDGPGSNQLPSHSDQDALDVVVQGYVRPDATRFPNLTAPQLVEEVMADVEKAIDGDLGHGARVFGSRRFRVVIHDIEGAWSAFILTEECKYNRRRAS